ncbi:transcriptional regulator [Azospira oryzae PS]|uniref:Transcriptional regulator n=1 Tax=Azospira oryzae (strain ATCC BAA-33 / DSM 13638 / PS) TaxID=640081 RepID=G8QND0_AZOOP|nr:LysR substrate-binding domain-containing protein [Azospira oryzae]AEV24723.1 transcriptional regulator [Azospira oryzae PS]
MPSLRQIRYFLSVADLGGFTPAAAALHVAQPALSRQIAQLEEELGFALLRREPRGVSLTEAGALFRQRVGGLEEELRSAAEDARRLHRGEGGVLRLLHSSSTPLAGPLLAALQDFTRDQPRVRVDVDRLSSEQQQEAVAQGRADLGLARLPLLRQEGGIEIRPLPEERLWAALPAGHALAGASVLALGDLADECFVFAVHRERGGLARRVPDLCLARGFTPRLAPVTSRKTAMLNLVAAGFGIAVVPAAMASLATPGVHFVPLADADALARAALLLPLRPSALAAAFADALQRRWSA